MVVLILTIDASYNRSVTRCRSAFRRNLLPQSVLQTVYYPTAWDVSNIGLKSQGSFSGLGKLKQSMLQISSYIS